MVAKQIVEELRTLGSEATKKVLIEHGAKEPFFEVKVEGLKKIQKRMKANHQLALDLYYTACKVPSALDYIEKVRERGAIGKKRKTAKC